MEDSVHLTCPPRLFGFVPPPDPCIRLGVPASVRVLFLQGIFLGIFEVCLWVRLVSHSVVLPRLL